MEMLYNFYVARPDTVSRSRLLESLSQRNPDAGPDIVLLRMTTRAERHKFQEYSLSDLGFI